MPDNLPTSLPGHPPWCALEYCELRTGRELALHRSTPVLVSAGGVDEPAVSAWLAADAFEDPAEVTTWVMIRTVELDSLDEPADVTSFWLETAAARHLHATVGALLGMAGVATL